MDSLLADHHILQSVNMDSLLADDHIHALPPAHVVGLLQQVVTHPTGDGHHWGVLFNKILLPAHLDQGALHLVTDLVVTRLLVACHIAVHLVHTYTDLLHTQQVDQAGMLAGLALDLSGLVVALGDGRGEVTISWHHDQRAVSLRGTGNHVLDEVAVTRGIDDGVVPLLGVELLGGACNGHTALTFFLLAIHVESKGERSLSKALSLLLELLKLTFWESTKLEDQTT